MQQVLKKVLFFFLVPVVLFRFLHCSDCWCFSSLLMYVQNFACRAIPSVPTLRFGTAWTVAANWQRWVTIMMISGSRSQQGRRKGYGLTKADEERRRKAVRFICFGFCLVSCFIKVSEPLSQFVLPAMSPANSSRNVYECANLKFYSLMTLFFTVLFCSQILPAGRKNAKQKNPFHPATSRGKCLPGFRCTFPQPFLQYYIE